MIPANFESERHRVPKGSYVRVDCVAVGPIPMLRSEKRAPPLSEAGGRRGYRTAAGTRPNSRTETRSQYRQRDRRHLAATTES